MLFLFGALTLIAQDAIVIQDKKAEPYLNKISEKLRTDSPYQIEFRYEIYSLMEDATVSDYGRIIIQGEKYKLKTEDTEVYFNGKTLWSYNIINEEVYQSEPTENSGDKIFSDPFRLLANYKEFFKYKLIGEKNIDANKLFEIELYPKDLETPYSVIKILTSSDNDIYSLNIKQKNGIDLTIFITDLIQNITIPPTVFSWDAKLHPNVLLIEM